MLTVKMQLKRNGKRLSKQTNTGKHINVNYDRNVLQAFLHSV